MYSLAPEPPQPVTGERPAVVVVQPEQVTPANAHAMAQALWNEVDQEEGAKAP
jgi:hypothetical protein